MTTPRTVYRIANNRPEATMLLSETGKTYVTDIGHRGHVTPYRQLKRTLKLYETWAEAHAVALATAKANAMRLEGRAASTRALVLTLESMKEPKP